MSKIDFDPYAVLGVARTATFEEIRAAYRAQVGKYHPDQHQGNPLEDLAAARLSELNQAYEILSDPARRAAYDAGISSRRGRRPAPMGLNPRVRKAVFLTLGLIFLVRFFPTLGKAVGGIFRWIFQSLGTLRGTPFVAAGVALVVILVAYALVRRRRKR